MSSDSENVDNPQEGPSVRRKLFYTRKQRKTRVSVGDDGGHVGDAGGSVIHSEDDYDSDKDPEFVLSESFQSTPSSVTPVPTPEVSRFSASATVTATTTSETPRGSRAPTPPVRRPTPPVRNPTPPIVKVGRKRKRDEEHWMQKVAKQKRQTGQEYVSVKSKKIMPARKPGPICKDRCMETVPQECRDLIFQNCWELPSYDARLNYYNACVTEKRFKRKYTAKQTSLRPMKLVYHVKSGGNVYEVCKIGFQNIHGITNKEMTVFLRKRKQSATGTLPLDRRGRREPASKIKGIKLQRVHEHIQKLSVTSSHYSRIKNPHRQYTATEGLTIRALYSAYDTWMLRTYPQERNNVVTFSYYKYVFTTCYNIAFRHPQTDVCNECTSLKQTIKDCQGKEEKQEDLEAAEGELEVHTDTAKKAQALLKEQKDNSDDDTMIIAVDLEQTLPCPKLSVNRAYYTRKLWVYNLCIYDIKEQKPTMYLWDETQGGAWCR